jgi:hypothetical protein
VLDWSAVLSSLAAQALLTALAVVLVYFTLKREIEKVRADLRSELGGEMRSLKVEVADLKFRVASVERALQGFGETLIEFLAAKGVVSEPERVALRGFLAAALPPARCKYYTEEVRRRLLEVLERDEVTVDDLRELDRISDLIYKEYLETGREDLIKYYYKLRTYIALLAGLLRSKARQRGTSQASMQRAALQS